MSTAADWAAICPACWVCGGVQVLEYGTDMLGRVWCYQCAMVEQCRRDRVRAGRLAEDRAA